MNKINIRFINLHNNHCHRRIFNYFAALERISEALKNLHYAIKAHSVVANAQMSHFNNVVLELMTILVSTA